MTEEEYAEYRRQYMREYYRRPGVKKRKLKQTREYHQRWTRSPSFRASRADYNDGDFYEHYDLWDVHGTDLGLATTLRDIGVYLRSGKKINPRRRGYST